MTVGIVGLGLVGGSLAKAYRRAGDHRILVLDIDKTTSAFAVLSGTADGELNDENIADCDVLLIATYPEGAADFLLKKAAEIGKKTLVIDCLGTKSEICALGFSLASKNGFTFVGGHPMAGTHNSGYKHSREDLFDGAPIVIVPPRFDDIELLDRVKSALVPVGFGSFSITTAREHDRLIAFTSQLAHVVSNAYIKSPTAVSHEGFSAGSYRDLTRVAQLAPAMWTQLFLQNADNLTHELDILIEELQKYRGAIDDGDAQRLEALLDEGRQRKKEIDRR